MLTLYPLAIAIVAHLSGAPPVPAQDHPLVLSLRERAEVRERWLEQRLDTLLPVLMRRAGVDAWVLFAREYNEDPVLETMLPARWMSARRRTVLVFTVSEDGAGVERAAVSMDGQEGLQITFAKNGLTPGDSYVFLVDAQGLPSEWRMWTTMTPGGLRATWEGWETLATGARVATVHEIVGFDLKIGDVAADDDLGTLLAGEQDPCASCEARSTHL